MGADGIGGPSLFIPGMVVACSYNDQRIEEGLTFIHMDGSYI